MAGWLRLRQHTPGRAIAPEPSTAAAPLDVTPLKTAAPVSAGRWHSLPARLAFSREASRRATARAARARGNFSWPWRVAWVNVAWALFSVLNLLAILVFSHWETVPFHFIWISLTLLYGFRVWATRPTLWVLTVVMGTTFAAISWDVYRGAQSVDELNEVPLMAIMFWLMVWHAQRRLDADHERDLVSDENARLLATQRRFLQDASHQLRTPITIALGHAELLARELTDRTEHRDIQVVVGELAGCGASASGCWSSRPPRTLTSSARSRSPWTGSPWTSSGAGGRPPTGSGRSASWTRSRSTLTGNGSASRWTHCWKTPSGTPAAAT